MGIQLRDHIRINMIFMRDINQLSEHGVTFPAHICDGKKGHQKKTGLQLPTDTQHRKPT
jgi:hypothetical protein